MKWYKQFPEANPIFSSKHYSWMDERGVYFPADISGPRFSGNIVMMCSIRKQERNAKSLPADGVIRQKL